MPDKDINNKNEITAAVMTLGCRVNQYESDVLVSSLKNNGVRIVPFGEKCDICVVNTCTVTAESDRKSRQMIRRAATLAEHVVVAGCFGQISPEEAMAIDGVDYVCGNGDKKKLDGIIMQIAHGKKVIQNGVVPPVDRGSVEMKLDCPNRTRSYIKIEDGCENRCAYCIINKARGPVRSKSPEEVMAEAEALACAGSSELVLTGIETASYGMDFADRKPYGHALADLVCRVATLDKVKRIRLGSLEPTVMSEYFVTTLASAGEKIMPHFHLSMQSGSSEVLRRMRRRYSADMALAAVERMKKALPGVTFSADIITGFPGETEENFAETVEFCRKVGFLHLHIFPYSIRRGTEAAEMENQIPEHIKKERLLYLESVGEEIKSSLIRNYIAAHRETPVYMLTEKCDGVSSTGHSEHFVEIKAVDCASGIGDIVPVVLYGYEDGFCLGRRAD